MTTNTKDRANTSQQIEAQENELKELLSRVIKSPLQPLERQLMRIEERLLNVEDISKATADRDLPAVHAAIRAQGEGVRKDFTGLRAALADEFPEMLTACLASMQHEMAQLLEGQTSVKDQLSEVQREQTLLGKWAGDASRQSETLLLKSLAQLNEINNLGKEAVQASENAVTQTDKSREQICKNLDVMQANGHLQRQEFSHGMATLAGNLNRISAQVTELSPALTGQTDELGSRLESGFTRFHKQSEQNRNELSCVLQVMQKRILWLSALCGLSFAGSVGLVVSRFAL